MGLHSTLPDAHSGARKVVHAVCSHDCPDSCGVLVTVDELTGRAVKLQGDPEHPVTRGFLCGKVAKYLDRVFTRQAAVSDEAQGGCAKGPTGSGT